MIGGGGGGGGEEANEGLLDCLGTQNWVRECIKKYFHNAPLLPAVSAGEPLAC